ncbi:substrate-binding domain-containing protein [Rubrimonas cliftonensis]|uniref:Amino acid ABC transporter substrate-binding protein, PAAT family n=1 Tax=Rubrimonas cliftonensis TaxID=89524 RepID=A0A1H4GE69_9RHOB|nr:substrate-binding domain-containing protein [Rubrimonas cliftonensis]SEB07923.1 amino acid ABC transporter substrate-binding protein, PAAT family [Rubrimonas cliftonensis]
MHGVRRLLLSGLAALCVAGPAAAVDTFDLVSDTQFRVCADPANMPFSNEAGEGFENAIAELLASKLGKPVAYTWFPQSLGFVRRTLAENRCDVIMGFAQGHELVLNTNHYYVSAYSFVTRADSNLADVDHIGDPRLQGRRLGLIAGSPPADHAARHGLVRGAKGYRLMVDTRNQNVADQVLDDIESGEIDGAFMWGPIAGWKAMQAKTPMVVTPLLKEEGAPRLFFRVTLGVRMGEDGWKRELNSLLRRNKDEIDAILSSYGVPLVDDFGRTGAGAVQ